MHVKPVIVIHGGAWAIPEELAQASREGVRAAAKAGYQVLCGNGGTAIDAVETAVRVLEDDPAFDAGTGSVLTSDGTVEMDSVIMDGRDLKVGAIACVHNIANPVSLARLVMDKTEHTMLVGAGADRFAREMGVEEKCTDDLITDTARQELHQLLKFKNVVNVSFRQRDEVQPRIPPVSGHDTVGAVAIDSNGNVAFATSTGGITAKRPGRVGDSPLVGCGGYADNNVGAVSTTGHGESITKVCLAHLIITNIKQGMSAEVACESALKYMSERVRGSGGAVSVSSCGQIGVNFTTQRMAWAHIRDGILHSGLDQGENIIHHLNVADRR